MAAFLGAEPEEAEPEDAAPEDAKPLGAEPPHLLEEESAGNNSRRFFLEGAASSAMARAMAFSMAAVWSATQRSTCSAPQGHALMSQGYSASGHKGRHFANSARATPELDGNL